MAIGIFIKHPEGSPKQREVAHVYHRHLYGLRDHKYQQLTGDVDAMADYTRIDPQQSFYLFIPQNTDIRDEYHTAWNVKEMMAVNVTGFQTHRDPVAIAHTEPELATQVKSFLGAKPHENEWGKFVSKVNYRPFDTRWGYLHTSVTDRPRRELLDHVLNKENLCLNMMPQTKMNRWQHALISTYPAPAVYVEVKDGSSVFPLYLYPDPNQLFKEDDGSDFRLSDKGRRPNLSKAFVDDLSRKIGLSFITDGQGDLQKTFGPEDVLHYAYAVLHSPGYRARYAEFLKIDFPRLPLTSDADLFRDLCGFGAALVKLHLLQGISRGDNISSYPQRGDDLVLKSEHPRYDETHKRIYINKSQYFQFNDDIDIDTAAMIWEFQVGGYQVAEKWLKDRRERRLTSADIQHYQKVLYALWRTDDIMTAIDERIPGFPIT